MKLSRADRGIWAVAIAAGAAMVLCLASRSPKMTTVNRVPNVPPPLVVGVEGDRVDINTAGLEELMTLKGIGEVKAQAIIDNREANGPFVYPEDLTRVKGIGEGTLANILDQITTGG